MKKLILFLICGCFVLTMGACGPKDPQGSESADSGTDISSGADSVACGSDAFSSDFLTKNSEKSSAAQSGNISDPGIQSTTRSQNPRGKVKLTVEKNLIPLYSGEDDALNGNPDRGFRLQVEMDVQRISTNTSYENMKKEAAQLIDKQLAAQKEPATLVQSYMYLWDFNNRDITAKGLQAIEAYLEVLKIKKMKAHLRFAYSYDMPDPVRDAPQEIILRHIQQLKPIVAKWKDVVHTLQAGIVGAWGEWHSEYYPLDRAAILKAITETLLPEGIYLQMRLPEYKNMLPKTGSYYKRTGIHNDSVFGKIPNKGYGTGGLDSGTAQWQQLINEAAYTPQDGELFVSWWSAERGVYCDGFDAVKQFSEHRFTSLSSNHGYSEYKCADTTAMGRWKKQMLTENWLKTNNIIGSPSFFKDKSGKAVERSVFEFVQSHLGYRIEAQSLKVTGDGAPGSTASVTMPVVNHGFSAAFNLHSGFAILDESGKAVATVASGDPETWYNRVPDNYNDGRLLTHTLKASLKLPAAGGRYRLAFYLKNSAGEGARLANAVEFVNGYNILHDFDI